MFFNEPCNNFNLIYTKRDISETFEEKIYKWKYILYYKFLHFQILLIFEMEKESCLLSNSMPKTIEHQTLVKYEDSARFRRSHLQRY